MTTNELAGRPPIVDLDTWQVARAREGPTGAPTTGCST
jgi:hypothetical protein